MDEDLRIEHKRKLLTKGKWGKFTSRLQELGDEGFNEDGAWKKAYEEMRVDGGGEDVSTDRAGGVPARKRRAKKTEATDDAKIVSFPPSSMEVKGPSVKAQVASAETIIEWVAEHLNDKKDTKYAEVPTTAAVNMLITVRDDEKAKSKFYLDIYMKMLMQKGDREHEERRRMGDDGRVLRLLDDFERISEEAVQ